MGGPGILPTNWRGVTEGGFEFGGPKREEETEVGVNFNSIFFCKKGGRIIVITGYARMRESIRSASRNRSSKAVNHLD